MERASITNRINCETRWLTRRQLVEVGFRSVEAVMTARAEAGHFPASRIVRFNQRVEDALAFNAIVEAADNLASPRERARALADLGDEIFKRNREIFFSGVANQAFPINRQIEAAGLMRWAGRRVCWEIHWRWRGDKRPPVTLPPSGTAHSPYSSCASSPSAFAPTGCWTVSSSQTHPGSGCRFPTILNTSSATTANWKPSANNPLAYVSSSPGGDSLQSDDVMLSTFAPLSVNSTKHPCMGDIHRIIAGIPRPE
jgi:hypothetical protein